MQKPVAIILAAGLGSRLRPMTNLVPKGMVKVNGRPIIQHQIEAYKQAGLENEDIFLSVGYKAEVIVEFIKNHYPGIKIIENLDFDTTNNMFSLFLAMEKAVKAGPKTIFISNGDCVYHPSIISQLSLAEGSYIACDKGSYMEESMKVIVKGSKIVHISKQITESEAFGNSIDLYRFDQAEYQELLRTIQKTILEEKKLNLWTEVAIDGTLERINVRPFNIDGAAWMEIDNYEDLAKADVIFSELNLDNKKCLCFDLDGTVHLAGEPLTEAVEFIQKNQEKFKYFFMTNNTSISKKSHLDKLLKLGLPVTENDVLTPYEAVGPYLVKHNIQNVFLCASEEARRDFFDEYKFLKDSSIADCDAIVLGFDTEMNYEKMKGISQELQKRDVRYFATHSDVFCPTPHGNIPDIGCFIKLIEMTTGKTPEIIFGKPNDFFLSNILNQFQKHEVLVVGDRLYTDKLLADNCGVDFALVLTGETKRSDLMEANRPFPAIVLKDFSMLS